MNFGRFPILDFLVEIAIFMKKQMIFAIFPKMGIRVKIMEINIWGDYFDISNPWANPSYDFHEFWQKSRTEKYRNSSYI